MQASTRSPEHWAKALDMACATGHEDGAREAIANGADVNALSSEGWTPLHRAVLNSQPAIIKLLVASGVDLNKVNDVSRRPGKSIVSRTPLMLAKDPHIIKLLLELGANPDFQDEYGYTALHVHAMANGTWPAVKALLEGGANSQLRDRSSCTPLCLAKSFNPAIYEPWAAYQAAQQALDTLQSPMPGVRPL